MRFPRAGLAILGVLLSVGLLAAQPRPPRETARLVRENFLKQEVKIPMRDGVHLHTAIYTPKDTSQKYPFLMMRTPYSVGPYGKDLFPSSLGPSSLFVPEGYIFVYQDVRGCYMSEGRFVNMTPHRPRKTNKSDIDESTDTYDTIEWLIKNIPNHNGKVGQWGISYPGFYAAAGMIEAHAALKAVSPQAPIADWFFDDFHHHGAFFLPHAFNFLAQFGQPRPLPTTKGPPRFDHHTLDGYQFFYDLGSLKNVNDRYFKDRILAWNEMEDHPNYDGFWKERNLLPHLKKVAPAVMTVGGLFDAEDLYGPLKIYRTIEKENPGNFNVLVMGPWQHGGWSRGPGDRLGNVFFGGNTAEYYRQNIELPFFQHFLKGKGDHQLPEAYIFETGVNRWRRFQQWPPQKVTTKRLYLHAGGKLSFEAPGMEEPNAHDSFVSDPAKPVPFTEAVAIGMTVEYMTDDQRFAARRPDVLVYQTEVLKENLTLAGPLRADLRVSTSEGDADWVVKLIDVFPGDAKDPAIKESDRRPLTRHHSGYQMMVRSEAIRGRFRHSYEKPEPFKPNQPTQIQLELLDVMHTFPKGHRLMIQVQSTWFPLVDRNPQKWVDNIFKANDKDFTPATHKVYRNSKNPTSIEVGVFNGE